jgi:hypothetical protein
MPTSSRYLRRTVLAFAVMVALAAGAFIAADVARHDTGAGSPAGTVRDFLITAVTDRDGTDACTYLTADAVRELAFAEPDTECPTALAPAHLTLGGEALADGASVKGLAYHVRQSGGRAWVTVSAHGATHTFTLRRATAEERAEFDPPDTPWRIDTGVDALVA